MSVNIRNYKGGAMHYTRNEKTVRLSICGTTPSGNTVVSNFDFPPEEAVERLEEWARQIRAFWTDERQRKVDQHTIEIERGDRIFGCGRPKVKAWPIDERRTA